MKILGGGGHILGWYSYMSHMYYLLQSQVILSFGLHMHVLHFDKQKDLID